MKRKDESMLLATNGFWAVLAAGAPPTVDKVNNWLEANGHGRRDRNLIAEVVKACWTVVGERVQQTTELPGVPKEAVDLFLRLREDLLKLCREEFDEDRARIAAEAQRTIEAAQTARDDAEKAVQEAHAARDAAASRCQELNEALATSTASLKDVQARLGDERVARRNADLELANFRALTAAEVKRLEEHRDSLSSEVTRLTLQIDEMRQAAKAARAEGADLRDALQEARERESKKEIELAEVKGRCIAHEKALALEQDRLARAEARGAELDALLTSSRAAEQLARSQVERLESRIAELSARPDVTVKQIEAAIALAWATAAGAPGRIERGGDTAALFAERGARYAAKAVKTLF